ncbi:DNA-processing protein DprA [Allosediminivita pacifica]|uniref:DNA processing protein n=1 Tax=Allosediminivita pacifica TaxID=1267769 RepID=A0A2T6B9P5_9RHOB|nr:DNA-processing protein DprA [Allosediminivita pacifica]PTX52756.1 DNA processing protein [Allosediminivita pacifica]GGA96025.1 DNA processing protein DprA [Allosediminivita pacifica]
MMDDSYSSTHPPLPPTTEDDRLSWLRLLRSRRVGVSTFFRLLGEHGSAQAALEALPDVAAGAGVRDYRACPPDVAAAELQAASRAGARMVCFGSPDYPPLLSEISDPPPFLWVRGDVSALARDCVALVGARNASSLGLRMARALSAGLGEAGFVVASGLARGIDTAAHRAALENGTVGVLAGGVDVIYPAENTTLAEDILGAGGALVSEAPMGLQPQARHFPARNRIVSGVARGLVVVEAAAKSGSLITARAAAEQGREVMAVPGHPFDARAGGCNMLIRDGARLVRGADDVVEALPLADAPAPQRDLPLEIPEAPPERRSLRETADLHGQILARLGQAPLAEDQLIRDLAAPSGAVSPVLTDLELEGRIRRQPGGLLSLR